VVERTHLSLRARLARVRANALLLIQCAVAATIAWFIAVDVLGHNAPFFAPLAAIISIGTTFGHRTRRAVELVVGVAVGIGVADVLAVTLGTGTWQLGLMVLLAMVAAVLLGSGPMLVTQAGASAALVATLQPPGSGLSGSRFVDALIGGGVALVITSLLPIDPLRLVKNAARPVLAELASTLDDLAGALTRRDRAGVGAALQRARSIDPDESRLRDAIDVGRQTARAAPPRRGSRGHLEIYAQASAQIDLAVRNVRVLARGAIRAVELDDNVPPEVGTALRSLAEAVRQFADELEDPERDSAARAAALRAASQATAVLEQTANLSVSVIVGQIRSTAVDLLRGLGDEPADARRAVREATTPSGAA
jgi:uncharacterized membrane protein YgaE (UPF0421/DUF939 family)